MSEQEQKNVAVDAAAPTDPQVLPRPRFGAKEELKQFYLEQSRRLCPTTSVDSPESQRLGVLRRRLMQIIKTLKYFDRPWESGAPEVQKACLHYLTAEGVPRGERLKAIEEWMAWTNFLIGASHYRSFISQLLQDYFYQLTELERIMSFTCPDALDKSVR